MTGSLEDDIRYSLGEMNGKLDMLIEQGKVQDDRAVETEARTVKRHDELEARVRAVENKQWWLAGAAAGIGAGASHLMKWLSGH